MKTIKISLLLLLSSSMVFAQNNTEQNEYVNTSETAESNKKSVTLKPRIGLGVGSFTFFGDVGGDNAGYSPFTSDIGLNLRVTNEITPYLDVSFDVIYGYLTVNEYNQSRHLNFKSKVTTGGISFSYNFDHFLKSDRFVEPWVSVGISSFEFLSKTDRYDADGNMYHYWSDGSIRNMAENAPDAENAVLLQRDYTYETDLRELNADGLGKYQERSWSVPVGAGVNFLMTDRFKARLGATMHMSFTDMIDNVSSAGIEERQGNNKNDNFLFSSLALNYDLSTTPKQSEFVPFEIIGEDGEPMIVSIPDDADEDGVDDTLDKCPGSPIGAKVDKDGCPVDTDGDGYHDYIDSEPNTPEGALVNNFGEEITDQEVELRYLAWTDSIPWRDYYGVTEFQEDFASIDPDPTKRGITPGFTVQLGSDGRELSQGEINALLSLRDFESVNRDGEDSYIVGKFQDLPNAVERKIQLGNEGIEGEVKYDTGTELQDVDTEAHAMEDALRNADTKKLFEYSSTPIYRVQLGAFRYDLSENIFTGISDLIVLEGNDGLTRYMTGTFDDPKGAADLKVQMLLEGFEGAFLTAYKHGERITLAEAGLTVSPQAKDEIIDVENHSLNTEFIKFKIQLGNYAGDIPTEVLDQYLSLGSVKPRRESDGSISFITGEYDTINEAQEALEELKVGGIEGGKVVGDFNGKIIPSEEATKILNDENDLMLSE